MKRIIWFLLLAAAATGLALLMGDSRASAAIFWPPYRISLSLNLLIFGLLAFFILLYFALRTVQAFLAMPGRAQSWREQYHERAMYQRLLDAHMLLWEGRFSRAAKAAEQALEHAHKREGDSPTSASAELLAAHLLAAESAHQLRDTAARQRHKQAAQRWAQEADEAGEALKLRAAHWALDDGEPHEARAQLAQLPQGAQRRIHALRLKLKAAQLAGDSRLALETTRLLAKHNAFSPFVAQTLRVSLLREHLAQAHDLTALQTAWKQLPRAEQEIPEVTFRAAERMLQLAQTEADHPLVRERLAPLLARYASLPAHLQLSTVLALEDCMGQLDRDWLARIENSQKNAPRDLRLQYLAGVAYLRQQLWGKAQHTLEQLISNPQAEREHPELTRRAHVHLAQLAEYQGREADAQKSWRKAALLGA
ncbi:MAG: heme biosynthesis HemY N-terminal domain-containing protein [Brachymonas sp.]|jgi:HemY protein